MKRLLLCLDRWLFAGPWQRASFLLALLGLGLLACDSDLGPLSDEVDAERGRETLLRQEYADKVKVAAGLPGTRQQLASMLPGTPQALGFSVAGFSSPNLVARCSSMSRAEISSRRRLPSASS